MLIFLGIMGIIIGVIGLFLKWTFIWFVVIGFIALIIFSLQEKERTQPLTPEQMEKMNEYDKRFRKGEVSKAEFDNILVNQDSVINMFYKYYFNTEFLFDIARRRIELKKERLSMGNNGNTNEENFQEIKKLELRLEKIEKQKQEWKTENEKKGLHLDYYGNHGNNELKNEETKIGEH